MLGLAIALLILNIFLMLFLFFKLNKRFSDANLIREIRNDAEKLVADIAYQTDKSVTVIEAKIKDANYTMQELEKRIVLAKTENDKKVHESQVLAELNESNMQNKRRAETRVENQARTENRLENLNSFENQIRVQTKKLEQDISSTSVENSNIEIQKNDLPKREELKPENEPVKIYTKQVLLNSQNSAMVPKASMQEQIIEMARKGFSIELIAEKVPLPIGEIELIISMNT